MGGDNMRDFTKVSPTLHGSRKFRSLGRDYAAKCVYQYLLSCPHGNSAGCFDIRDGYACDDLDMDAEAYRKAMQRLCEVGLISFNWDTRTVFIANWMEYNTPTNPKHAVGMLAQLGKASDCDLKTLRAQELISQIKGKKFDREAAVRAAIESLSKGLQEGIATETRPDQRPETRDQTETETRPDLDLREGAQSALRTVAASGRDGLTPDASRLLSTPLMKRAGVA
jgi:hypothetical protein